MKSKRRHIGNRIQLAVDEILHLLGHSPSSNAGIARGRLLQMTKLEERVLMSASPMAMIAEVATVAVESSPIIDSADSSETISASTHNAEFNDVATNHCVDTTADSENSTGTQAAAHGIELIVIDSRVQDADTLLGELLSTDRDFRLLRLNSDSDGLTQISDKLERLGNVSAIHLLTHGNTGEILFGSTVLNADTLAQHAPELLAWQHNLTANADILLYGCDVAATTEGKDFVESLHTLTGADVAASVDATGHEIFAGNWDLEFATGVIEATPVFIQDVQQNWVGKLASLNVTTFADVVDGNTTSVANLLANKGNDGFISLREAILAINAGAGGDTINLSTGTYTLTRTGANENAASTGDLDILKQVTIVGSGAGTTVIDANGSDRAFHIRGVDGQLTILGATIQGGDAGAGSGGGIWVETASNSLTLSNVVVQGNSATSGAGIDNAGNLTLTDVTLHNNGSLVTTTQGGGLRNTANATLNRVTIYDNRADLGGGIYNDFGSGNSITLSNVTLSGNSAQSSGGAVYTRDDMTVVNSTITLNVSGTGGGIRTQSSTVSLQNAIVAGNSGTTANPDLAGTFVSGGSNLIGDGTGQSGLVNNLNGDKVGNGAAPINPLLGSLQDNGGPTLTHALLTGSTAIDGGTSAGAPTNDQRGMSRTGMVDIGAYEYVPTLIQTGELAVNVTLGQSQDTSSQTRGSTRAVSIAPNGNYVIVWTSNQSTGSDANGRGVLMRIFRPDGSPLTGEIQVNQTTNNDQQWATVATDDVGNGVVVWTSTGQDQGSSTGIYARRFDASGALVGNEISINSTTSNAQEDAAVAMSGSGSFIVTWSGKGTGDANGIFYRRFDAADNPLDGTERLANATNRGQGLAPSIAMNDVGQFAIAWHIGNDVYVRHFAVSGTPTTADVQVDNGLTRSYSAAVGIDALGQTTVVYRSDGLLTLGAGVWARAFNADGSERVAATSVATGLGSNQTSPSIAVNDAGNFIVTYQSSGDGSGNAVFVQRYNFDFSVEDAAQQVNVTTSGNQQMSSVALLDANNYIVVWSGQGPGDSDGVFARQFSETSSPPAITSNGGGSTAVVNIAENTTAVTTVTATDADIPAQSLMYSISGGLDAARFSIDADTGVLQFTTAPDFETPANVSANNVYDVIVEVSDGSLKATQVITVTITNVNDTPPVVTLGQSFSVSELATVGTTIGTVAATDADGTTSFSNWSITGGNSGGVFAINASTGQLTIANSNNLNFDVTPGYVLSVTVSDGVNTSAVQNVSISILDSPNTAPVATNDSYAVLEGGTLNQAVVSNWFNPNWQYRQKLVFDNSASSTNLTIVAVLVKLHATASDAITIDYSETQNAGQDLRFVDADGTILAYEIERWDETGYSYVWVKVPQIDGGSITDSISMYYGNSTIAASQNPSAVWSSNNVAVLHMNSSSVDSTSYSNHGIVTNVVASTGQVAGSGAFDGLTSSINVQSAASVDNIFVGGGAISAWINPVSWGEGGFGRIADKGTSINSAQGWGLHVAGTTSSDGHLLFESDFSSNVGRWKTADGTISLNAWQHVVIVYDNTSTANVPKLYVNGIQLAVTQTQAPGGVAKSDAAQDLYIGNRSGATDRTFSGRLDEVRISSTSLSTDQIKADYKTSKGTFLSGNAVQVGPGGLLDNDFDSNGDLMSVSLVAGPSHAASFTLNPDGSFSYVHDGSETTTDSFTYRVTDGTLSNTATVSLSITPVNDNSPVITSNGGGATAAINVAENATSVTTVTATDADLPAQSLTYSISGGLDAGKFTISSTTGALSFLATPNYEIPTDNGANNVYNVTVRVTDGTFADTQDIAVTVTPVNDNNPVITSNSGGATASISIAENATSVTTVTATDADLPTSTLTYSISGGLDAGKFTISSTTGVLSFLAAPNYEIPTDNGTNNVYNVTVRVTDGTLTDTQDIAVTVTPVNDNNPVITSNSAGATASISVAENTTSVTTVTATDADLPAQTLTYSISGGLDAAKFTINSTTGALSFLAAPNCEVPTDSGTNNIYNVTVRVSDGTLTDTQNIAVTVTPVNDNNPVITSNSGGATASISVAENTTSVTTVTATDADLPAQTLAYSISGGLDAAKFTINSTTGALSFLAAPNYEIPTDNGTNNVYSVTIRVSDGTLTDTQDIAVTVTPVNDNNPVITSNSGGATASISVAENTTSVTTVTATDADLPAQTLTYSISGGVDAAKFTINSTTGALSFLAAPNCEVPTDSGTNNIYNVTVRVSDGTLTDTQNIAVTVTPVNDNNPVITSNSGGATAAINIAENTTDVTTVTATDADLPAQSLTYSISGGLDAAKFTINSTTGALSFLAAPNYEIPTDNGRNNVYNVTIRVSDGTLTDTLDIAVTVTPVNDNNPVITSNGAGATGLISVAENTTSVTTVTATDADLPAQTLLYTISGGADAAKFTINSTTGVLNFLTAPEYESPTDNGTDNVYAVIVQVTDGISTGTQRLAVVVTNVNEAPTSVTLSSTDLTGFVNGASVGTLNVTDPDAGDSWALSVSDSRFEVVGGLLKLKVTESINPIVEQAVTVTVRATDVGSLFHEQAFTITVSNPNTPPTLTLTPVISSLPENSSTLTATRIASITINDDGLGVNTLTLSGAHAAQFQIVGSDLYLRAGMVLDFETLATLNVTVSIDDATLGGTPDDAKNYTLTITDVNELPSMTIVQSTFSLAENAATTTVRLIATITINDDALGTNTLSLTGTDTSKFRLVGGNQLVLKAGTKLDFETKPSFTVDVSLKDTTLSPNAIQTQTIVLNITDIDETPTANAGGPYTIAQGDSLTVAAGPSIDPEGLPLTYAWDIDNDGQFDDAVGPTAVLTWTELGALTQPFNDSATRTIKLQVTDAGGNLKTANAALTITDTPPTIIVTGNATATSGTPYKINISTTDFGTDTITSWDINWGDGTIETIVGTISAPSHTYAVPGGTRSVFVTGTDENGTHDMSSGPLVVTVLNTTPSAPGLSNLFVPGLRDGAIVGSVSFTDPDFGDSHIVTVSDSRFRLDGLILRLKSGQQLNPATEPAVIVTVTVTDVSGANSSSDFTLRVNNPPVSVADSYAVDGTQQLSINNPSQGVLANDNDADGDALTANLVSGPTHATAFGLNPDGTFWYRADGGYSGLDTFRYEATDGTNSGTVTTVTFTVNQPATLAYTSLISSLPEHQTLTNRVKVGNFTITDDGIGTNMLTLAGADAALFELDTSGQLFLKAGLTIDYATQSQFRTKVKLDDAAISGTPDAFQNVVITVQNLNDVPIATPLPGILVDEDSLPGFISTSSAFSDADGDPMTYSLQILTQTPGLFNVIGIDQTTGAIHYSLNANAHGTATLKVTAKDPSNAAAAQQFQLTVQPVNDAPVAQDYAHSIYFSQTLTSLNLSSVVSDVDMDTLSVTLVSGPAHGTLILQSNGSFTYTPNSGFQGTDTFRFVASDGVEFSNIGTAAIRVINQVLTSSSTSSSGTGNTGFTGSGSTGPAGTGNSSHSSTTSANGSGISANQETSASGSTSATSSSGANGVMPVLHGDAGVGLLSGPAVPGDNVDNKTIGVIPRSKGDESTRAISTTPDSASNLSGRGLSNEVDRRVNRTADRYDFDRAFDPAAATQELSQLNTQRELLYREIATHAGQRSDSVAEQLDQTTQFKGRVVGSVGVVTTGFSVGYLFWAIRGGMLVSGLIAQVPAWSMLDPLLVIDGDQNEEDKESLQNIMDRQQAKMNKTTEHADSDEAASESSHG